ncbi:phage tail sheath protein, partial [Pseudoflavonifractor phocaeensis]|nr:phage tail sheath protein [Pseudoflavonifractor phocaeensis]
MPGGTWTSQNKVRPGVYIRFTSTQGLGLTVGERGTVAICEPMSWGPVGQVMTVEAGADTTPFCGYDITSPEARFLQQIFLGTNRTSGANKVLLYRPTATSSA